MIMTYNSFECDMIQDGKRIPIIVKISKSFQKEGQSDWHTYIKVVPFHNKWIEIYGENSWQSMTLAIAFAYTLLNNYSESLYFKDSSEKIPLEAIFVPINLDVVKKNNMR